MAETYLLMKNGQMDDNELIKNCLQGNTASYRLLMEKYGGYAMAVALNILMNYPDAEDVCQEAFLKAYQNLNKFDLQKNFKNWFSTVLYNLCLDTIRKRKHFRNLLGLFRSEQREAAPPRAGDPPVDFAQEFRWLRCLSPKERLSIHLWAQEGYTGEEIASVLKCSPKTAHVYLWKARRKIKTLLRENKNA
jgi:RNA polymerase sigma-70 factor (ECF subfamily)